MALDGCVNSLVEPPGKVAPSDYLICIETNSAMSNNPLGDSTPL